MPLLVPTEELHPGMQLYEPIVSSGRVMMQGGRALSPNDVDVIRRRYPGMAIRIADPVLDQLIEFEDDAHERKVASETQQRVSECMNEVQERFSSRASMARVDFGTLQETVNELMEFLKANPSSAAVVSQCLDSKNYLGSHAGNVFYLSMLLGSTLMDYVVAERKRQTAADLKSHFAMDLAPLGLAAMVLDVGMIPIQHLLSVDRPLTPDEATLVRDHPTRGAEALPDSFSAVARTVVRQHHENIAGSGYPKGLRREKVHIFTRIVRVADAYDAATSGRVYAGAKSPARVLWEMTAGPYKGLFDQRIMQAFAGLIQPFPIGSRLKLKDGRGAAVVRYNRKNPFDPEVVVAFDANNEPLPKEKLIGPLYLSTRRDLKIDSLHGEDLSFIYSSAPPQTLSGQREFQRPIDAFYP